MNDDNENLIERMGNHPYEEIFNIEPGTTLQGTSLNRESNNLVSTNLYDSKDSEIEQNFQEIYDTAMDTFDDLITSLNGLTGEIKVMTSDVAVKTLNTALAAAKEKSRMKEHKDKLQKTIPSNNTINGNVITNNQVNLTTNELIKMLQSQGNIINNTGDFIQKTESPKKMQPKLKNE